MHEARLMHGPNTAEDLPRNVERHKDGQPPSAIALSQESRQREVGLGHRQDPRGPLRRYRREDLQEFDDVVVLHLLQGLDFPLRVVTRPRQEFQRMPLTTCPLHSSDDEPVRALA